ncbi:MAG: DsbA family protein [Acidimicrobiales bacterium]
MTVIDVYADIWCPFTHVGLRRLVQRRDEEGADLRLRVRPWPLELVNGKPMDPEFIAEEVGELRAQAAPDLFSGFRADTFPTTTLPALALVESAHRVDLVTGEKMSLLLRSELFERGRDIGDAQVLAELASTSGVPPADEDDHAAVRAQWEAGKERGVVGSPHFFTSTGAYFCPALDIKRVDGHFSITPDVVAFEAFVAACFA